MSPEPRAVSDSARRLLCFICVLNILGLLYAGLNPFHSPLNEVRWVSGANILHLGEYGVIVSARHISPSSSNGRTLEIWMRPALAKDSNTFLAFYDPGTHRRLSLQQSDSDLKLLIAPASAWSRQKSSSLFIDSAFRDRDSVFWTIASGPSGTSIYRNAVLTKTFRDWLISSEEFSGRLVFGTSPIFNENWSGTLRGLAIYNSSLSASQILRHYQSWNLTSQPKLEANDSCAALYILDEHSGSILHDKCGLAGELVIPPKYQILNQTLLDPIWRAFNWSSGFWRDAIINVTGFVPPCFFFCCLLSARGFRKPALASWLIGSGISLVIEVTQAHLPTRDSSMSDLVNNVAGSIIGANLYRGKLASLLNFSLNRTTQFLTNR
jgi:hypothetical protein